MRFARLPSPRDPGCGRLVYSVTQSVAFLHRPFPSPSMFKFLFALAVGIALGYNYGWNDAQVNEKAYYERLVDQIGGTNRDLVRNDIDARQGADGR